MPAVQKIKSHLKPSYAINFLWLADYMLMYWWGHFKCEQDNIIFIKLDNLMRDA